MPVLAPSPPKTIAARGHSSELPPLPPRLVTTVPCGGRIRIIGGPLAGLEGIVAGELDNGQVAMASSRLAPGVLIGVNPAQIEPVCPEEWTRKREKGL